MSVIAVHYSLLLHLPNHLERLLDNRHAQMRLVIYQTRYIVLWHFRQLLLKDAFESSEDNVRIVTAIIVYHAKFYLALSLLDHGGLTSQHCFVFLSCAYSLFQEKAQLSAHLARASMVL